MSRIQRNLTVSEETPWLNRSRSSSAHRPEPEKSNSKELERLSNFLVALDSPRTQKNSSILVLQLVSSKGHGKEKRHFTEKRYRLQAHVAEVAESYLLDSCVVVDDILGVTSLEITLSLEKLCQHGQMSMALYNLRNSKGRNQVVMPI